jgi:hypothetical protein
VASRSVFVDTRPSLTIATLVTCLWYDAVTRAAVTVTHHPPFWTGAAVTPVLSYCNRLQYRACSASYTTEMRKIIAAVVFIGIALWLGIYVVPDLIANMVPGEP